MKGKRCIGGGRPNVRTALYMAALSATHCNPVLSVFYKGRQRKTAQGRPHRCHAQTAHLHELSLKTLAANSTSKQIIPKNDEKSCKN